MKFQAFTKLFFAFSLIFTLTNCQSNDDFLEGAKVRITDFSIEDLAKLHGGNEKTWILTNVILPQEQKEYPSVPNNDCVSDDIYTFPSSTNYESVEVVTIELGDNRCFKTISDAENFEAKLLYVPYNYNGETLIETTLILTYSRITNLEDDGTSTVTNIDAYRLSELTEDRMVFSTGSEYVGEYSFAYVFEKL